MAVAGVWVVLSSLLFVTEWRLRSVHIPYVRKTPSDGHWRLYRTLLWTLLFACILSGLLRIALMSD